MARVARSREFRSKTSVGCRTSPDPQRTIGFAPTEWRPPRPKNIGRVFGGQRLLAADFPRLTLHRLIQEFGMVASDSALAMGDRRGATVGNGQKAALLRKD